MAINVFIKNNQRTAFLPTLEHKNEINSDEIHSDYLEEVSLYFSHLMLDHMPSTCAFQRDIALRYVVPKQYEALKTDLSNKETFLKKNNISTQFLPYEIKVAPDTMTVYITGDLMGFTEKEQILHKQETYEIKLAIVAGRLMIEHFEAVTSKNNK